jgi:hypothetical protein
MAVLESSLVEALVSQIYIPYPFNIRDWSKNFTDLKVYPRKEVNSEHHG